MGIDTDTGLSAVTEPDAYSSRRKYSVSQLLAISRQLARVKAPGWVSDRIEYETRSGANSRAETLSKALTASGVTVQTATTKVASGKFIWAIRARK